MVKHLSLLLITIATVILWLTSFVEVAAAQPHLSYVSGKGTDRGNCDNPSSPCRTFQYAVDHTSNFGEVTALDPDNYGLVTINKVITLTGVEGAGIYLNTASGSAITINAELVNLTGLTLDGNGESEGRPSNGIVVNGTGQITITHCTIRNFRTTGIDIREKSAGFLIAHTLVSNNANGISILAQANGFAGGVLDHVRVDSNRSNGIVVKGEAGGQTHLVAVDITVTDNRRAGISVEGPITNVMLAHSTITGNGTGIAMVPPITSVNSFGDNYIRGNGQDIYGGTLVHVGTQ